LAGAPLAPGKQNAATRKKMLDDAVDWLRNNSSSAENLDNPTVHALTAEMAGIPLLRQAL